MAAIVPRGSIDANVPYLNNPDTATTSTSSHHDEDFQKQPETKPAPHEESEKVPHELRDSEAFWEPAEGVEQDDGVTRIEALYIVFGKGWGLIALWASIFLIAYAYSLSGSTTYVYEQFAASAFGKHSLIGTISVITACMSSVAPPFIAKCADIFTRPWALLVAVIFYFVGYAVVAGSKNIESVAGGMVIYTLGNSGISFLQGLLVADITSLEWRGIVLGLVSLPFIPNAFIAGYITEGINGLSQNGWRWGYGMFCILVPVLIAPALIILFIGDYRAKKLGALSLAAPSYYRRQVMAGMRPERPPIHKMLFHYWTRLNGFGLLLLGFSFGCILVPFTLKNTAQGGYKNPSLIAMLVVGGVLFIGWLLWDIYYARYPIMPRRVLNPTFLACIAINFFYYFSGYFIDVYWSSFVYVVTDFTDREYQFYNNILTCGLCGIAVFAGFFQKYFHRYKYQQIVGLSIRCVGMGISYAAAKNPTDALLVTGRVIISIGGAISVISSQVAAQGSVPHQDLGIAIAVQSLWTNIGGAISQAISATMWTDNLPQKLTEYIGDTHNATQIQTIFGSIIEARLAEPRDQVIRAYTETMAPMALAGFITSFLGLIAGFFATDFRLGKEHNSVETQKIVRLREKEEVDPEVIAAKARAVQEKIEREARESLARV